MSCFRLWKNPETTSLLAQEQTDKDIAYNRFCRIAVTFLAIGAELGGVYALKDDSFAGSVTLAIAAGLTLIGGVIWTVEADVKPPTPVNT